MSHKRPELYQQVPAVWRPMTPQEKCSRHRARKRGEEVTPWPPRPRKADDPNYNREKLREWRAKNPDKVAAQRKRVYEKRRNDPKLWRAYLDRINASRKRRRARNRKPRTKVTPQESRRRYYEKLRNDPEKYQRKLAGWREYNAHKLATDPDWREHRLMQHRVYYKAKRAQINRRRRKQHLQKRWQQKTLRAWQRWSNKRCHGPNQERVHCWHDSTRWRLLPTGVRITQVCCWCGNEREIGMLEGMRCQLPHTKHGNKITLTSRRQYKYKLDKVA